MVIFISTSIFFSIQPPFQEALLGRLVLGRCFREREAVGRGLLHKTTLGVDHKVAIALGTVIAPLTWEKSRLSSDLWVLC